MVQEVSFSFLLLIVVAERVRHNGMLRETTLKDMMLCSFIVPIDSGLSGMILVSSSYIFLEYCVFSELIKDLISA